MSKPNHPSHDIRFSMSDQYDEICDKCGRVNATLGPDALEEPCPVEYDKDGQVVKD